MEKMPEDLMIHLKEHITYPASKADIMAACSNMTMHTDEAMHVVKEHLPEGMYNNADEAMKALERNMM